MHAQVVETIEDVKVSDLLAGLGEESLFRLLQWAQARERRQALRDDPVGDLDTLRALRRAAELRHSKLLEMAE